MRRDGLPVEQFDDDDSRFLGDLTEAEIGRMLAERERNLEGTPRSQGLEYGVSRQRQVSAEDRRKADLISDEAKELIIGFETGGRAYYEQLIKSRPHWPGGASARSASATISA